MSALCILSSLQIQADDLDLRGPCVFASVLGVDALKVEGIRPDIVDRAVGGISGRAVVFLTELYCTARR